MSRQSLDIPDGWSQYARVRPLNPPPVVEAPRKKWTEQERLAALRRLHILDTPREAEFDDVAHLTAEICKTPIAVICLVDQHRQWFKAEIGLAIRETPPYSSICRHAIYLPSPFVIVDATKDDRFASSPLITGPSHIRFCAGALLETDDGLPVGTLCVLDREPRPDGLTERQEFALKVLARQVMSQMTLRLAVEERQRLNETLETRVREEVAAREAAQATLTQAQRVQALGQLAAGVAHDFNNILQTISGGVRQLERQLSDRTSQRLLGMLNDAADRGAAVTRRLLAFTRCDDLLAEPIDAAALLDSLREMLSPTLGTAIEVVVEASDGLPRLLADKRQLETVLVNLATNARDAMPEGGRLIFAASANENGDVELSVTDGGIGMDQDTLARAAEPFFTTKPAGKGTGLGLAMARSFAVQSGGDLRITSEKGHGTTVTLLLPPARVSSEADRLTT